MTSIPPIRRIEAAAGVSRDRISRPDRRARSPRLMDAPRDLASAWQDLVLVFVGLGSVGLRMAEDLVRCGPGRVLFVDPGRFKAESLLTHPCTPQDVGRNKALVAGERAAALSPETQVHVFEGAFASLPAYALAGTSQLLVATDNLHAEVGVAERALELGIDFLQASVWAPGLVAQVRSIPASVDGQGPCACCGFGAAEWAALDRGTRFSCEGGDARPSAEPSRVPTMSLPHLCSIAANLAAMELTRKLAGIGDGGESRIVQYGGYDHRTTLTPLVRRNDCPLNHSRARLEPRSDDLGRSTPRALVRDAGYAGVDPHRVSLRVEGLGFARLALCECRDHPSLGRFVPTGATAGSCRGCGAEWVPHPLHFHEEVPVSAIQPEIDRTLASLGATAPNSVRVRGDAGAVLFHRPFPEGDAGGGSGC